MMRKTLLVILVMIGSSIAVYAKGSQSGEHLNYGFTLLVVAIIALYSAKLVADKQKQAKNKTGN